ncbi:ABC transporter permease [Actinomadura miaoliensis]|uniref:ABC transporter permease n=1 Tax=Actinomadura miaoliensis TaxID=430685 RepID=A0ABP7WJ02_9ACTN
MNARVLMVGVRRGWAEHLQFLRDRRELAWNLFGTVGVFVALAYWQGGENVEGTDVSRAVLMAAGFTAFSIFSVALLNLPVTITADREDGVLLRMRTVPGGIPAYLCGRAVAVLCQIATYVLAMLAAGLAFTDLTLPSAADDWLTLAWVLTLGTLAVAPLGAALGTLLPGPRNAAGVLSLPITGLMLISGVMFPITALPEPVRWVAQAFPLYWQGLGLRSVFLPDSMLAAEIGGGWRPAQTAAVLGAWAVAGLLLAPPLLRRAARRESAARPAGRRLRAAY